MTLLTRDDHLTAEAWAAKALAAQARPQNTGGPSTAPKHWRPKHCPKTLAAQKNFKKKKKKVALFCFKGWYRYVHVSFTYFLEQVQNNFELS